MKNKLIDTLAIYKFGGNEWLEKLQKNKEFYINTIKTFKQANVNNARYDEHEDMRWIINEQVGKIITIDNITYKAGKKTTWVSNKIDYWTHIYSLYTLTESNMDGENTIVDKKMFDEFGGSALVFTSINIIKDIENTLIKNGYDNQNKTIKNDKVYAIKQITYFNAKTYSGECNIFMKTNDYAYQREYRIAIKDDNNKNKGLSLALDNDYIKTSKIVNNSKGKTMISRVTHGDEFENLL